MKILVIGLDKNILSKNSPAYRRAFQYAREVSWYGVVVPCREKKIIQNENFAVYGSGGKNKIIQFFRVYFLTKEILKKQKVEIISVQDIYYLGLIGLWLGRKYGPAVEIQVHGFEKLSLLRQEIAERVFQKADSLRVVGDSLAKKISDYFGIKKEKITLVPIYTDWQALKYKEFDRSLKKKWNNNFVFLVVSRLVKIKNVDNIIRAFSKIYKDFPEARLVIVGDGPLQVKLKSLIQELGLSGQVDFFGWQQDVVEYYRNADCYILFSSSEGYGLSIIEALSYQLPVITTKVGIATQVVKDGENGLLVKQKDIQSLADMMRLVQVNRELLADLKKNTRKYLTSLPTRDEVISLYKKSWRLALLNKKKKNA